MVAPTYNEELFDAYVRHQMGLLRFSGHVRNRIWRLLDATEVDLRTQINNKLRVGKGLTPVRLRRMEELLKGLRETRVKAWTQVDQVWLEEMRALAQAEASFAKTAVEKSVPADLAMRLPNPATLKAIVDTHPFEGRVLRQWSKDVRRADLQRIEDQVKIGMTQGESSRQISRRVVGSVRQRGRNGVTQITRHNADAITRTAVNAIGTESRRTFAEENTDIFQWEVYTATLDSRTTFICASLDGTRFRVGEGRFPPLHFNCRSLRVPTVDGKLIGERPVRSFTEKQLLREFSKDEGIKAVPKRALLPRGTKGKFDAFKRKRMRELTGTTPSKTTFEQFLRRQSKEFQDDYLGPERARLFREGKLPLSKFVDKTGKRLTLAQLSAKGY